MQKTEEIILILKRAAELWVTAPGDGCTIAHDAATFKSVDGVHLYNVWCISFDVNDTTKPRAPVLFTQNFNFANDRDTMTFIGIGGARGNTPPYGTKGGVVVTRGGAVFMLDAVTARGTNFFPYSSHGNTVMWANGTSQFGSNF